LDPDAPAERPPGLSKSRALAGLQCHKQLWWRVHEPTAPELAIDAQLQARFDRGHRIGERARAHVPGGVLIDLPSHAYETRLARTRAALAQGAPAVYEAAFRADDVFVSVDILERIRDGVGEGAFCLTEVKSTTSVKEAHLTDAAIQAHVARHLREGGPLENAAAAYLPNMRILEAAYASHAQGRRIEMRSFEPAETR